VRWAERGVWERIFFTLAGVDGVPDRLFIDSTCIKHTGQPEAQKGGLGQWYRPDTRGRNSKVHAICDVKGRSHVLMITPGNVHDLRVAKQCIAAMPPSVELVGEKGYVATTYANGSPSAALRRSSRPSAFTKFRLHMIWQSKSSAISSSACFAASRTGEGSPRASTAK
jgi:hypothetical protein